MSIEAMKQALKKAFNLGQTYWHQADSENPSYWKKADATKAEFEQLVEDTCQAIAEADKQEQPLPPVEIGVDVTAEGATVVGFYRRPDALMEMFYSQFHPQPKREWVGLTHSDIDQGLLRSDYALKTAEAWRAGVVFAMTKLKDKNT